MWKVEEESEKIVKNKQELRRRKSQDVSGNVKATDMELKFNMLFK